MAKIKFREIRMSKTNIIRLSQINSIIEEYQEEGYVLTLRQLYYQLVSRDIIPNKQAEYSKLSTLLKEGRMAGIVDWDAIEDRLRKPDKPSSFDSPQDILEAAIRQYALPRQEGQPVYIEVWVEKDALSGVLKRVTEKYHIPILVNRGYSSASAMFDSFKRFMRAYNDGQYIGVLYLGDFDPSGIDMIRDIKDRIIEFVMGDLGYETKEECLEYFPFSVTPIALTKEQIRLYNPPPNPAKITDPRSRDFIKIHGKTSWEVDALRPEILNELLNQAIHQRMDVSLYEEIVDREDSDRAKLSSLISHL